MLSGLGSLLSGNNSRPVLLPQSYLGYTSIYNLPFQTEGNRKVDGTIGVSARDEKTSNTIIENTMWGLTRLNYHNNYMIFVGDFYNRSNHQEGNLIVELNETLGVADSVVIGDDIDQSLSFSWSGLSHTLRNYLWLSTVEDSDANTGFQSSRYFRNATAEATTSYNPPSGYKSVLVGTFLSGEDVCTTPEGFIYVQVNDHAEDNQDPHGLILNQQYLVTSGIEILNTELWPYGQASGAPVIFNRDSLKFLNNLTILPNSRVIVSGVNLHIVSGTNALYHTLPLNNFSANSAIAGWVNVTSGLSTSGSTFHIDLNVTSGVRVNGVAYRDLVPLISGKVISGSRVAHIHSIADESEADQSLWPEYAGMVPSPHPANTVYDRLVYDTSLDGGPTLRRTGNAGWVYQGGWSYKTTPTMDLYIRHYMPAGCTQLDKIEVYHRLTHSRSESYFYTIPYPRITARIIDAIGTELTPSQGGVLHNVSGVEGFMLISGISQSNLAPNYPWDLKLNLSNIESGTALMLGEIRVYYKTARE